MIQISDKKKCCGCTACDAICPTSAIHMKPDQLGFLYPSVDLSKCIDCHLCEKVCAFTPDYETPFNLKEPIIYGARHKDITEVAKSRSGGIFAALSDYVLDQGGVVYGAGYDETFRVIHKRVDNERERNQLRGSKYVQSDIRGIYKLVEKDLKAGIKVLFSGTPCQLAGLNSYLKLRRIDCLNLLTCDIVCHGVPSPYVWRDYLQYLQHRTKLAIVAVDFRDKTDLGWTAHKESITYSNNIKHVYNHFTLAFYKHIMLRDSCESCPYTNFRRTGDITLADFWGWEKTGEKINNDDKGLSLILVNTPKGHEVFKTIESNLDYFTTAKQLCLQPQLQHPSIFHPDAKKFSESYAQHGFKYTMEKYGFIGWKYKSKKISGNIKRLIKSLVKHVK